MVLVRLTSKGPSIYTQVRLGRGNCSYTIYKIRTMYENCEAESGPKWSTKGDSRVTPIGRILRSSHIDELPQLWNVLRGEMSLVGPRPERPAIAGNLELVIPATGTGSGPPRPDRPGPDPAPARRLPGRREAEAGVRPVLHPLCGLLAGISGSSRARPPM